MRPRRHAIRNRPWAKHPNVSGLLAGANWVDKNIRPVTVADPAVGRRMRAARGYAWGTSLLPDGFEEETRVSLACVGDLMNTPTLEHSGSVRPLEETSTKLPRDPYVDKLGHYAALVLGTRWPHEGRAMASADD